MSSSTKSSATASSGIQTNRSGEQHIPQSVRADGSIRKEIKVRPGYRPPEDVQIYKNRTADNWKSRLESGVPGAEGLREDDSPSIVNNVSKSKNAKRRSGRKRAKASGNTEAAEELEGPGTTSIIDHASMEDHPQNQRIEDPPAGSESHSGEQSQLGQAAPRGEEVVNPEAEQDRQARNLKKKLRQAKELQNKKESGESLLPEQFAKVIKIQELIRQLEALGFDSDGAPKPKSVN